MKKTLLWLVLAALVAAAFPPAATAEESQLAAVGFNVHGYYRVRYDNYFDLSWAATQKGDDSDWWSWVDQRMLLQPTLIISDPIEINSELDILHNVMWGDNALIEEPAVVTERQPNDPASIGRVRYGTMTFRSGNLLTHSTSDTDRDLNEVDPIAVRQLYMRVTLPIGYLKIGRQADQWGMGVYANSGSPFLRFLETPGDVNDRNHGYDADSGDVYDRFQFGTRVAGFYFPSIMYDRIAEDSFKTGDNDVHAFTLANQFRDIRFADSGVFDAGFFIQGRTQQATSASLWLYDLWLRLGYAGFKWELEGLGVQGKATFVDRQTVRNLEDEGLPTGERGGEVSIGAYLGAARFLYDSGRWSAGLEWGFSSPEAANPDNEFDATAADNLIAARQELKNDPQNANARIDFTNAVIDNQAAFGRRINTYAFDPDYKIDLITWDRLMGGALKNGMYLKAGGYLRPLDGMHIGLNVLNSYLNESGKKLNGKDASHDLGWETDLNFAYTFHKQFTADTSMGYMIPGMYFRDMYDDVSNVYTFQIRTIVNF
ncbi:MAG: hypothetical protein GX444_02295 [Myxococcales bacterium]|nr:hypothetical protein [Myxococcales bacterium]